MSEVKISFLGGAGTVTGSKHLISFCDQNILVDCGLFQGIKEHRLLNWAPLHFDAAKINAVVLTHAHLDHCGYLPLLVKQGFAGKIYCSRPTIELTKLLLLDAAKIQEERADHANQFGYSKHKPALPLYSTEEAKAVFGLLKAVDLNHWHPIGSSQTPIQLRLSNSGHILGSTFLEFIINEKRVVFSGDLGRPEPILLQAPTVIKQADFLILESTYGDRTHGSENPMLELGRLIVETAKRGGQILIPAFALGRSQDILHLIAVLKNTNQIPDLPVFLDSPMAEQATEMFDRYEDWHGPVVKVAHYLARNYQRVSNFTQSVTLTKRTEPAIVIAGAGMLNGGRIQNHLLARLSDPKNTVIIVGFQAAGTLGRFLQSGAKEVKLMGTYVPVNAQISTVTSLSAHADQLETLSWLSGFSKFPKQIFLVHGEANALEGLRVRIKDAYKVEPHIAKLSETVTLC